MSLSSPSLAPPAAITAARLQLLAARCDYTTLAPLLDAAAKGRDINTPLRVAHWLAQLHHESGGFLRLEEGLSYSAERLCEVWPLRFRSAEVAKAYARNPRALANRVYADRMGNGDAASNDGWRFRGRGYVQITGRDAYRDAAPWSGVDLLADPDRASEPAIAAKIAAGWWAAHGCNEMADHDNVEAITRRINGGMNGIEDRRTQFARARTIWRG